MNDSPLKILKSVFGYSQFRGQQQHIIEDLIAGKDALVLMPTGGGKSLCYQIPSLIREGVGIVISPLIALMQDQVDTLKQLGIRAAFLNSSLTAQQVRDVEQQLINSELDLLYIAPERLAISTTLDFFKTLKIALFAIDEAHCVSQWGHDFRIDYLNLSILHEQFPDIPRIALTATADERTRLEIQQRLQLENAPLYISGFDRPNIRYQIVQKQAGKDKHQLFDFISKYHKGDVGIVYCLSRKKVDAVAEWLCEKGLNALPYHAGLSTDIRQKNQQQFLTQDNIIIVATIAFGMGIDKPNVRFVAHLDLPKSVEAYYQETGRAGRDGLPANAWMAYGLGDIVVLRRWIEQSEADEVHKKLENYKLDAILALCEQVHCRRQTLLQYFGETLEKPCGNCDCCLEPPKTWDGTLAARQALSCVFRTGQRFGVSYLIDVLQGLQNERIRYNKHDQLTVFGIGKDLDETQWHSVFRQLVSRNLVTVNFENFNTLQLTEASRPILRDEQKLLFRYEIRPEKTIRSRKLRSDTKQTKILDDTRTRFWNALRDKRRDLADAQNVPNYTIFHDATLMAMMEFKPRTLAEFGELSGVGEHKLKSYGNDFLKIIQAFSILENEKSTAEQTIQLFKLGFDVEKIAEYRQLQPTTIFVHLADGILKDELKLSDVISLSNDEISEIQTAFQNLPDEFKNSVKPVFEQFNEKYSYEILRCVRAALSH
ncbi:MAG: DNA helicase RecQ [Methylococcaceae bacterium]